MLQIGAHFGIAGLGRMGAAPAAFRPSRTAG